MRLIRFDREARQYSIESVSTGAPHYIGIHASLVLRRDTVHVPLQILQKRQDN
jgi:hypothetical protein